MFELQQWKGDLFSILTAASWAVAVIFFKRSGESIKTVPLKVFQNLISIGLFFTAIVVFSEPLLPQMTAWEWWLVAISALLGVTLGDTFYIAALNRLGASSQAIMDCLYSPAIIFMAFLFFHETLSGLEMVGAGLVVIAVFIGTQARTGQTRVPRDSLVPGLIYGVLSQLTMALCIIIIRDILREQSVLTITAYRFLIGNTVLMTWFAFTREKRDMFSAFKKPRLIKWTLPGTFLGPFLSTILWFLGFKYTLAGRAAIYNQMSTIFIIILAIWFLNEHITRPKAIAVSLAIAGGLLVSW